MATKDKMDMSDMLDVIFEQSFFPECAACDITIVNVGHLVIGDQHFCSDKCKEKYNSPVYQALIGKKEYESGK